MLDAMARGDLTNQQWARLEPLLPRSEGKRGHPYKEHRHVLNGILWLARTGAPWRDLPERYGPWKTCHDRIRRWARQGLWKQLFQELLAQVDAEGKLDWSHCSIDSTVIRAHQHAAGARRDPDLREPSAAEGPSAPSAPQEAQKRGRCRPLGRRSGAAGAA